MNTLQHSDLKVNAGKPKRGETPMWKGKTSFRIGGKQVVAAVSADRTWWRVRFEGIDEALPPEMHAQMINASFYWGKKEGNLCYFGESNEAKVMMLRTLGYSDAKHITTPIIREVEKVKGNVEHPAQVEGKGKRTTTVKVNEAAPAYTATVKVNKVGKPYDATTGHFIGKDELMNGKTVNGHPVYEDGESVGFDMDEAEASAYTLGFEMGRYSRNHSSDLDIEWLRGYEDGLKPDPEPDHSEEIAAITATVVTLAQALVSVQEALAKLVK